MFNKSFVGVVMTAWCLTASGSAVRANGATVENGDAWFGAKAPVCQVEHDVFVVDEATGLQIALSEQASGAIQVRASAGSLEVLKRVEPSGDVSLTLHGGGDTVSLKATRLALTVMRGRRKVEIDLSAPDAALTRSAAALLAGSPAIRQFRMAVGMMGQSVRESVGGIALELGDLLFRTLQDDPYAIGNWRRGRATRAPRPAGESCYDSWEGEVLDAWESYEGCYADFSWWSGGREGCATLYVIQVESAWFRMIGCSAIPLK